MNQVWRYVPNDATPDGVFKNPNSGRCLDVTGAATANGTMVEIWDCNGGPAQNWQRQPDGSLRNPNSGRCLDAIGTGAVNGTLLNIYDCNGNWNQIFLTRNTGALVNPQTRRCLDIAGAVTTDGAKIQNYRCTGGTNQVWQLRSDNSLYNPNSGKCADVIGAGTANNTLVQLYTCNATVGQMWQRQADGTLRNPNSGRCLDGGSNNPALQAQVYIYDCNAAIPGQQWTANLTDADGLQGRGREEITYLGGQVDGSTIHVPTVTQTALRSTPNSVGQDITAFMVTETDTRTRTWLPVSATWRWTDVQTSYNSYGLPTVVTDLADTSISYDDTCTTTTYATADTAKWLIDYPASTITTDCAASPGDADYLKGTQTFYDGSTTSGAAPTQGLNTKTNALANVSGGVLAWRQSGRSGYDANGRVISSYDALDHLTATVFTPSTGGPVTAVAITNPLNWTTTTTVEPGKALTLSTVDIGGKATTEQYDGLGRLTKVWEHNRAATGLPDVQYTYTLSGSVPNSIETQKLGPTGTQIASYTIYDGRLRSRQVQSPTPVANGGRMITDAAYDSRGLKVKVSTFYNNAAGPSSTLVTFTDAAVATQDRYTFDDLERQTIDKFYSNGVSQWQTTTRYQNDRTATIAPAGGTTTQKILDARGNTTQLRQYVDTDLSGSYQATRYTYDRLNQRTGMTDPAGNAWSWTYDRRGRTIATSDPDSGSVSNTYDDDGRLTATTDGRPVTLAYSYDDLGRRTHEYLNSTSGTVLADWTYDTLVHGQQTSSTVHSGANTYITAITGYDDAYRQLGTSVTVPAAEGALAGTWTTSTTYNVDGTVATLTLPAAGTLAAEAITNTYDANGYQLTSTGQASYLLAATYQPWGAVYQQTLGTGTKRVRITTDQWPDTHRAKTLSLDTESQTTPGTWDEQLTQDYTWDPAGNLGRIDNKHAGVTTESQCFGYDYLRELTAAWTTTPVLGGCAAAVAASTIGGTAPYWTSWTLDPTTGNRTQQTQHGLAGASDVSTSYTYPTTGTAKHSLNGTSTTGPSGSSANSYLYNTAGQIANATVAGLSTDYTWTSQGRTSNATIHAPGGDQVVSYLYDADGNEIIRKTPTGSTLYLGATEVTTNAAGTAVASATRYYTCNGVLVASRTDTSGLTWQANDHQGTAQAAINATSLSVAVRRQDPFGNLRGTVPAWPDGRGFVGGTNEPTGLVHLGARMYDPTTGRFTSDDPIIDPNDPEQVNGYSYASSNPLAFSDPDGKKYASGEGISGGTVVPLLKPATTSFWSIFRRIRQAITNHFYISVSKPNGQPGIQIDPIDAANNGAEALNRMKVQAERLKIPPIGQAFRYGTNEPSTSSAFTNSYKVQTLFRQDEALDRLTKLRYLSKLGGAMAVVDSFFTYTEAVDEGKTQAQAIGAGVGSGLGGWGGAVLGAEVGGAIGTAICPGVGTLVGGVIGGVVVGVAGSEFGKGIGDLIGSGYDSTASWVSSWL